MNSIMTSWLDYDFRPAPPGWRVAHISESPTEGYTDGLLITPLPGWLIQVENRYDEHTSLDTVGQPPLNQRQRRIIAATHEGHQLEPDNSGSFWYVIGPNEPDPTPNETRAELTTRATRTTPTEAPK